MAVGSSTFCIVLVRMLLLSFISLSRSHQARPLIDPRFKFGPIELGRDHESGGDNAVVTDARTLAFESLWTIILRGDSVLLVNAEELVERQGE